MNFDRHKLNAGSRRGSLGSQRRQRQVPIETMAPAAPLQGPRVWRREGQPSCLRAGLRASPADLLGPHVEEQVRGRQAKDQAIYREAAGLGHKLHSLKREGVETHICTPSSKLLPYESWGSPRA